MVTDVTQVVWGQMISHPAPLLPTLPVIASLTTPHSPFIPSGDLCLQHTVTVGLQSLLPLTASQERLFLTRGGGRKLAANNINSWDHVASLIRRESLLLSQCSFILKCQNTPRYRCRVQFSEIAYSNSPVCIK